MIIGPRTLSASVQFQTIILGISDEQYADRCAFVPVLPTLATNWLSSGRHEQLTWLSGRQLG